MKMTRMKKAQTKIVLSEGGKGLLEVVKNKGVKEGFELGHRSGDRTIYMRVGSQLNSTGFGISYDEAERLNDWMYENNLTIDLVIL